MKQQNYYDLLEISPQATTMDIIHAYRRAKLAFEDDSLATYSLFSDDDIAELRDQIEAAYHTLSDSEKRREYDAQQSLRPSVTQTSSRRGSSPIRSPLPIDTRGTTRFPGSLLREIREDRQLSLQSISELTRISKQYLDAIECEDESRFPEPVYLKGYLKQYARELGLDPEQVVQGYPPIMPKEETPAGNDKA